MTFRVTEEEKGIIDEAKKNGTYMKAPNGQPTNLNEKQWAQVRTKAFKKWFGDWETWFKKNFLLNGTPVANLTGNEFARVEGKTLTDQVAEYFDSIGNERYFCYVTITRLNEANRYYLHEVWTEKNLTNVGSNAVQGQPSRLQGVANVLQNVLSAKESSKIVDENGNAPTQKKEGLEWLSSASYNYQQEIDIQDLVSVREQNTQNL